MSVAGDVLVPQRQPGVPAHDVARGVEPDTLAEPEPRSRRQSRACVPRSMRTLRPPLIARAGRLVRIGAREVPGPRHDAPREQRYATILRCVAA